MDSEGIDRTFNSAEDRFAVPDDFPRPDRADEPMDQRVRAGLVEYNGVHYSPGCSPPELWERWTECEELVAMFRWQCQSAKQDDYLGMSGAEIIARGHKIAEPMQWCSPAELKWVFKRIAQSLGWEIPEVLK